MKGIVVGGNIRCFLKLAGTGYFPDLYNKILLLEAYGGRVPQMATYLAQLKRIGTFEKVSGIILGTFTAMEQNNCVPSMVTMVKEYAHPETPIAVTRDIGHGDDAKAIVIGKEIEICQ
jgi:muramoyltetrapeptide carboxypeptidase LdcA involved in peptidoglycan recycling